MYQSTKSKLNDIILLQDSKLCMASIESNLAISELIHSGFADLSAAHSGTA